MIRSRIIQKINTINVWDLITLYFPIYIFVISLLLKLLFSQFDMFYIFLQFDDITFTMGLTSFFVSNSISRKSSPISSNPDNVREWDIQIKIWTHILLGLGIFWMIVYATLVILLTKLEVNAELELISAIVICDLVIVLLILLSILIFQCARDHFGLDKAI